MSILDHWEIKAAKEAYEAYSKYVGGKAFNGDTLPTFKDLPVVIMNAWIKAATAAVQSVPKVDV